MNEFDYESNDPVAVGYARIRGVIRNILIALAALAFVIIGWGFPWIQWTYRSYPTKDIPTATDKIDADYWNPLFGWKRVDAGEYADGCPVVVFIPLKDSMDLSPYRNPVTSFLMPEDFFDDN